MSFDAMAWAVRQKCRNSGEKLVLLMLASHTNGHTGQCNPSHKLLADECCMGTSTLKNHLTSLADQSFLTVVHRTFEGRSLPNQYVLNFKKFDTGGQNLAGEGSESDGGRGQNLATKQEEETIIETNTPLPPKGDSLPSCPYDDIIAIYHETLPNLPQCKMMSEARKKKMREFWQWVLTSKRMSGEPRAINKDEALKWIRGYFEHATKNDFLMGRVKFSNEHSNWKCDFDFLLTERGKKHVIEKTQG